VRRGSRCTHGNPREKGAVKTPFHECARMAAKDLRVLLWQPRGKRGTPGRCPGVVAHTAMRSRQRPKPKSLPGAGAMRPQRLKKVGSDQRSLCVR